ncbi:MAG TPA: hypothetical protein DEO83_03420 [Lachnospiraceae bacterium]|nr:hypothetical protein [Lachnospiraceae bacterium]
MRKRSIKQKAFAVALAAVFAISPGFTTVTANAASETMEEVSEATGAVTGSRISIKDSVAQGQITEQWTFNYNNDSLKPDAKKKETVHYRYWDWVNGKYTKVDDPDDTYEETYNFKVTYPEYTYVSKWNDEKGKNEYFLAEGKETYYDTWTPELSIMIFDSGDRTKPDGGWMNKDKAGKYVISSGYKDIRYSDPKNNSNPKYEFNINSDDLNPGKKDVVGYILDYPAFKAASLMAEAADEKAFYQAYVNYENEVVDWYKNGSKGDRPEEPYRDDYTQNMDKVSEADYYITTNVVNIEVAMAASISTAVKTTSVDLSLHASGATGYEIYRKAGKKYIKIATVSSAKYTDKGLTSNTTYSYKVRPYYVNRHTGKTSYGKYTTTEVTTTGSALRLKATVTSKNKVKLTWKKVAGATKYQIYKVDTGSMPTIVENTGNWNDDSNSFSASKLIKTLKKSKKSYTDKDVLSNRSYSYMVRAVLPKNGKKNRYIDDWAGVNIEFGSLQNVKIVKDASGNKTVKWDSVYGASGYIVEKRVTHYKVDKASYNGYDLKYNASTGNIYYVDEDDNETINVYKVIGDKVYELRSDGTPYEYVTFKKSGNVLYEYYSEEDAVGSPEYVISGTDICYANEDGSVHYTEDYKEWEQYKKLGKSTTSIKLPATKTTDKNNNIITETEYRIKAYKGSTYGEPYEVETEVTCGVVTKVTATKAANGIKVTWSKVKGASYYLVYRVPTDIFIKNNDISAYDNNYGSQVYEYVGAKTPVKVDVAAWNKTVDDSIAAYKKALDADEKAYKAAEEAWEKAGDYSKPYPEYEDYFKTNRYEYLNRDDKLEENKEYYYQNYSYTRGVYTDADATAGIIDYCGDIYSGRISRSRVYYDNNGKELKTPVFQYTAYPVVEAEDVSKSEIKSGVSYTYYVVAYMGTHKTMADYKDKNSKYDDSYYTEYNEYVSAYNMSVTGPQLPVKYFYGTGKNSYSYRDGVKYATKAKVVKESNFKDVYGSTVGCKTVGTATFTETKAAGKPTLKSVKASKGKVTIKIKKKVKNASYYKIYRSTKKKGAYTSVGVTTSASKLSFTDKSAKKGKKYYYKVVSVVKNEAGGEVESKASSIKSVKAK